MATSKVCRICREEKPANSFTKALANIDGLASYCRPCFNKKYHIKVVTFTRDSSKYCYGCKELKLSEEFYGNKYTSTGLSVYCKLCTAKRARIRYKETVLDWYGPECACCGELEHDFLTVDHINGRDKNNPQPPGNGLYRWLIAHSFPSEYQILCWNCNSAKGVYGKCPHQARTAISPLTT